MSKKNAARTRATRTAPPVEHREQAQPLDLANLAARPTRQSGYPDNFDRAVCAAHAVVAYGRCTGQLAPDAVTSVELTEELAADLVSDLMHLVDKVGGSAQSVVEHGIGHHAYEVDEEAACPPDQASAT